MSIDWWEKPRRLSVVVDNPSWILPYAEQLVAWATANGDDAALVRDHETVREGAVAFYLGCLKITPSEILARNQRNLVVHASALPQGRGFSPMTWQTLNGKLDIPICLIEAAEQVDSGPVVLRDHMSFEGHELIEEMRAECGAATYRLCQRYLDQSTPAVGEDQRGTPSHYDRRRPQDSRLDPERPLAEQFDLLRTVDNDRYPAFFDYRGHRYNLQITKSPTDPTPDEQLG